MVAMEPGRALRWICLATLILLSADVRAAEDIREFSFNWPRDFKNVRYEETPGVLSEALEGHLGEVGEIVFAVRGRGGGHWYESFGYHIQSPDRFKYAGKGGRLCVLDLRTGLVRTLLEDATGDVRDPSVHYDGETILFSYRRGGEHQFHLYTIRADGTGQTQLTEGQFDDIEPCWLPDGGIMFCSSRCMRWVPCWYTQVAIMFRCDADGSNIRQISFGVETENTPRPLPDGRVAYTRWEYVDRHQNHYHGLWTINPDGTGVELLFDNMGTMNLYIDAKPIPGTDRIVTAVSPLHGQNEHAGRIGILDPGYGPCSEDAIRFLDRGYPVKTEMKKGGKWRDPCAVSENCFLAASSYALAVLNADGDYELIYELPEEDIRKGLWAHEPRPLAPRQREPVIPHVEPSEDRMAEFAVMDVSVGRNMAGIEPDDIEKLVVMEELPRPGANTFEPDAIGLDKNYILHRILGTVPVEEDGSAHFKAPAGRPLFFYALDGKGLSAKAMPSYLAAMPGEKVSCIGCHESRLQSGRSRAESPMATALKRPPSRIQPIEGVPEIFDYVRDIQPIWNRHCVRCHNYEKHAGDLLLVDDMTPSFSVSFYSIRNARRGGKPLIECHPGYEPDPYSTGSGGSRLLRLLMEGHQDVELTDLELRKIKRWADAGTTFAGTYAALDSVVRHKKIEFEVRGNEEHNRAGRKAREVLARRCDVCHQTRPARGHWLEGEIQYDGHRFNVTDPEKSLLLLAPLAESAGGLGLCRKGGEDAPLFTWKGVSLTDLDQVPDDAPEPPVFRNTDDPDYPALLGLAEAVQARYGQPRWFQSGHRPAHWYVREMKRFGALPEDFNPAEDSLDGYEVDRRYFNTLYRMGPGPSPK